jgi:hypothetical protein
MKRELKPFIDMLNSKDPDDNNLGLEIVDTHYKNDKRVIKYLMRQSNLNSVSITNNEGVIVSKRFIVSPNITIHNYEHKTFNK